MNSRTGKSTLKASLEDKARFQVKENKYRIKSVGPMPRSFCLSIAPFHIFIFLPYFGNAHTYYPQVTASLYSLPIASSLIFYKYYNIILLKNQFSPICSCNITQRTSLAAFAYICLQPIKLSNLAKYLKFSRLRISLFAPYT